MNDPYAMYEGFRTMCPVGRSQQHGGFYVASRYETVKKVFEEYSTFSSADGVGIPPHPFKMFPIDLDPPLQAKFRRVLNRRFTPEAVAEKRGEIQTAIDSLIDDFIERSEEHTSELQSLMRISYAVFCLKQKTTHKIKNIKQNNN